MVAWKLYNVGPVREMYSCPDRRLGVVFVLECGSVDEARRALDELPFVREGLIEFDFIRLGPFSYVELLFEDRSGRAAPPGPTPRR
jgi:hypothetical protein